MLWSPSISHQCI